MRNDLQWRDTAYLMSRDTPSMLFCTPRSYGKSSMMMSMLRDWERIREEMNITVDLKTPAPDYSSTIFSQLATVGKRLVACG